MRSLRRRLRLLEREDEIVIPQRDGPPARFPRSSYVQAFLNCIDRLEGGPDVPPPHPLVVAARNSSDKGWREDFFGDIDVLDEDIEPPEDLSEGATEGGGG